MTIQTLTNYQIETLAGYFKIFDVLHLGIIKESGDLIIEFRGFIISDCKTVKITREANLPVPESVEFEIIQPKQLK